MENSWNDATMATGNDRFGGDLVATYAVPVKISRQEDGLWRAECPAFQGCFVDDADLARAMADIQEAIRMYIDLYRQRGKGLPAEIAPDAPVLTLIPIAA